MGAQQIHLGSQGCMLQHPPCQELKVHQFKGMVTFLASAKPFSFGAGGGEPSKKRTSSPSEQPVPSLGTWGIAIFAALGNSAPGVGERSPEKDGKAGILTLAAFWRNLKEDKDIEV